jgi:MarR family transcriptional regulator, organic hydroperoxide resistance regulator
VFTDSSYPRDVTSRSGSEPEATDGGDPATEAWRLITAVMMARKQQFPQIAASFKLNPGALHALLTLDPDEPQRMSVLAGGWGCDASNVTWLVDRLEEQGLVERRADATDRRVRTVALTPKGVRVRKEVESMIYDPPPAIAALSPEDLDALCRVLRKAAPADPPRFATTRF